MKRGPLEKGEIESTAAPQEERNSEGQRIWRLGTLRYTFSGLAFLFLCLLIGDFVSNFKDRATLPMGQILMLQWKASDFTLSLLFGSIPNIILLGLGPVVGAYSDRFRSRWGRRIPFILLTLPFIVLSLSMMAFTPWLGSILDQRMGAQSPGLESCRILIFGFFWILFEVGTLTTTNIFYTLINDVVPRTLIGRFYGLFRGVNLLAGVLFNYFLIGKVEQHYREIFIGMGLLYGIGMLWMCLKIKEGEYESVPQGEERGVRKILHTFKEYFKLCFSDRGFILIFIAIAVAQVGTVPLNTFGLFYAKSLGISIDLYGKYLAMTYVISFVLAYGIGAATDYFHPFRVFLVIVTLSVCNNIWGWFFATTPLCFGIAFIGHGVFAGALGAATIAIGQRIFPRAYYGIFFTVSAAITAIGCIILPMLIGAFLDYSGHQYRCLFLIAAGLTFCGGGLLAKAYRKWDLTQDRVE